MAELGRGWRWLEPLQLKMTNNLSVPFVLELGKVSKCRVRSPPPSWCTLVNSGIGGTLGCKVSQGVSITKAEVQWGSLVWIWSCSVAQKGNVQVYKQ